MAPTWVSPIVTLAMGFAGIGAPSVSASIQKKNTSSSFHALPSSSLTTLTVAVPLDS